MYFGNKITTDTKLLIYDKGKEENVEGFSWARFELSIKKQEEKAKELLDLFVTSGEKSEKEIIFMKR
jgi:DNA relaxase NicK